jgi:protein kinase C substrate 80K-H
VCENTCAAVGKEYRNQQEATRKQRKTGSKIRSTYIAFAQKEKKRLEAEIEDSERQVALQEKEVSRLKDLAERTEALSAEVLEHKMNSPLYASLITHHDALKSLQRVHRKHLEREKQLGEILDGLRRGYNPNYQDMAVLEAVRGWEQLANLRPLGEAELEEGSDGDESGGEELPTVIEENEEELEEGAWNSVQLENELDGLLGVDHISLLMEHDAHVGDSSPVAPQHDLKDYLPDFLIPQYESLRDTLVSLLQTVGIVKGSSNAASDANKAREKLNDAERNLGSVKKQLEKATTDLEDLFDPAWYGVEGEWKKLHNTCLSKENGDYIYEVCLFEEARQKPINGGSPFSLGKFASWNLSPDVTEGSAEYYSKQVYSQGTRCWNGPQRNVKLDLTCGTENALLTVIELEKCEYLFTGTTPALCLPLEEDRELGKDEL